MPIKFLAKSALWKKPLFTETVKRFTLWNVGIFLLILIAFNIFIILITLLILNENLDVRLEHEAENIMKSFKLNNDTVTIIDKKEFEESDLNKITAHPFFLQVYSESGKILLKSSNINLFGALPLNSRRNFDDFLFEDINVYGKSLRIAYYPLIDKSTKKAAYLQLATFKEEYSSILDQIILFNLFSFPLIIIIVVIASFFLAKNSINPINKIIETAKNISASNLSLRIEHTASSVDELGKLRDTLNSLFERLEKHIKQISRFTDQASHQLMNPLTAIKTELEFILKKDRTIEQYKETLQLMQGQADKMISITKTLLIIARADKAMTGYKNLFNVSRVLGNTITESFANSNINLNIQEDIYLKGDSEIFKLVVENLIDNAVKYSNGELVKVTLKTSDGLSQIEVADLGIGISDEEKKNVFERFYRSEKVEKLGIKGYGLGLSLVKSIVIQLGGTIKIEDNIPKGTKVKISIPSVEIE
ncbi:MAG: hypothetical protein A2057_14780 [Ignavibacteria bacterium GWA2_35_9]|nr:MAG: hypothetical protein A2057_14780 [Ignavibacteria bacterium GWA2_35_9]OGU47668.1 MAG: hypothetical protein A2000_12115 [Ignavibacteria bacterium GWB2_36_8]OGU48055.1 MAG: hypothetical protein A2080_07630 [Ignavibacteria bacterium GWC2_36_12]